MAGVVFIIYVPKEEHENILSKKKKVAFEDALSMCKSANRVTHAKKPVRKECQNNKEEESLLKQSVRDMNYESIDSSGRKTNNHLCMQKVMEDILQQMKIENSSCMQTLDKNFIQFTFTLESGALYEEVLDILKEHSIGQKYNSVVSVIPCTLYYKGLNKSANSEKIIDDDEDENMDQVKDSGWSRFVLSVRDRLTVAQVVENIKNDAKLTFDYICLLIIATILCAIGLAENSNVYLLSSMLISPMMGPVMAGTFGTVIRDRRLQKMGVQNEILSLGIATVVGFCYGCIVCICTDRYGESDWPTNEMVARGEVRTLGVGCLLALLSGAAVALGILSDDIASLVGVAISTSLMPPAVNAGLLWSLASVYYMKGNETTRYSSLTYTDYYSTNRAIELMSLGSVSLCLTFVNIVCIYLAGILVFKIKEVAPIASRDQIRRQFWKHDIKIARDYNNTLSDAPKCTENEINSDENKQLFYQYRVLDLFHHSTDLSHNIDKTSCRRPQYTWSPCTHNQRPTIQEMEELFSHLPRPNPVASRLLNFGSIAKHGRRLSQLFSPTAAGNSCDMPSEETLIPIPDIPVHSSPRGNFRRTPRKFVVTPCTLECQTNN